MKGLVGEVTKQMGLRNRKDRALAGLRGLAVLLVLFSHLGLADIKVLGLIDFSGIGKSGVVLFFVLSAYLLTGKFLATSPKSVGEYARFTIVYLQRRALRIYPLYFIVIVVLVILGSISAISNSFGIQMALDHLLMRQGILHLWAVPVEMRFYAVLPMIMGLRMLFGRVGVKSTIFFDCLFVIVSLFMVNTQNHVAGENSISLIPYIFAFAIGYCCAVLEKNNINSFNVINRSFLHYIPAICIAAVVVTTPVIFGSVVSNKVDYDHFHDSIVGYSIAWGVSLHICASRDFYLEKILCSMPFAIMGSMSFSFYLWHPFVISALERLHIASDLIATVIFAFVLFPLCIFSHRFFEKPFMNIRPFMSKS